MILTSSTALHNSSPQPVLNRGQTYFIVVRARIRLGLP